MADRFWEQSIEGGPQPASGSRFDIIVVGGGPGGAAAAGYAALAGHRVLLLDKAIWPRDKTCGDAVGGKSLSHVEELGVLERLEASPHFNITGVLFSSPRGDEIRVSRPDGQLSGYVLPRLQFDHIMFQRASELVLQAGGAVVQGFSVREVLFDNSANGPDPGPGMGNLRRVIGIAGDTGDRARPLSFSASLTIGAGGVRCPVATAVVQETYDGRMVDRQKLHYSAAFRQYWRNVTGATADSGPVEFHYIEGVLPGYFWIFPVGNGVCNVGFGITLRDLELHERKLRGLQEYIINEVPRFRDRFAQAELIAGSSRGWQLPLGSPRPSGKLQPRRAFAAGAMLIGDAASLVDPFTGEGIGNALLSAKLAVGHFDREAHARGFPLEAGARYQRVLWGKLGYELRNSYKLQRLTRRRWLLNWFIGKARRKAELQRALTESMISREAQATLTSPFFLLRQLLF
jgi:geranylgeranyl reductase family protein